MSQNLSQLEENSSFSIVNIPSTINGVMLSSVGLAVMWMMLQKSYHYQFSRLTLVAYILTLYSCFLLSLYLFRIIYDPKSWFLKEYSTPERIFRTGIMSNTICLIAVVSSLVFSEEVPIALTFTAMSIQFPTMCWFLYKCFQKRLWPEPFYNAALQSCIFPVISLPGNAEWIVRLRHVLLLMGLSTLIPSSLIQIYRVLLPRKSEQEIVANNPSVCIMQTGWSIMLIAWLRHPLTDDAIHGYGLVISNSFFAFSTIVDLLTWVAMWQRRKRLYNFGINHPAWAPVSFPFASSAIAASVYYELIGHKYATWARVLLVIWVSVLATIATVLVFVINGIYFKNKFYLMDRMGENRLQNPQTHVIQEDSNFRPLESTSEGSCPSHEDHDISSQSTVSAKLNIPSLDSLDMIRYTRDLVV